MARQCTDIDEVLRSINQRLRKLEKSDSEKTEEFGRLNRIICQKDKEIHKLKMELSTTKSDLAKAKTRIKELEDENDKKDDSIGSSEKPEKTSSNSSVPPSQESIVARELRRTKSLRKPSGKPSGGQPGHKGSSLQSVSMPDRIIQHEPAYCKCCGRPLDGIEYRKIRKTQIVDIKFVVETTEEQYYEKVCQCGCVNNCDAPNCRIKYGDNIRALVSYLNVVLYSVQENSRAHNRSVWTKDERGNHTKYTQGKQCQVQQCIRGEEIRKRIECAPVVGADETGAAVGKQLHWNWIFQTDALTYVYQLKSRGQEAVDSKFPN